jgi:hypothetical protein
MFVKFFGDNRDQELQVAAVQHDRDRLRLETERVQLERDRINQQTIDNFNFYRMICGIYAITLLCVVFLIYLVSETFCATFNSMFTPVARLSEFTRKLQNSAS